MDKNSNDYRLLELTGLPPKFFEQNRKNYLQKLNAKLLNINKDGNKNSVIILEGGEEIPRFDTDVVHYHFQQESNFYYLCGVREPKFYGVLDLQSETFTLFYKLSKDLRERIFMKIPSLEELQEKYQLPVFDFDDFYSNLKTRNPEKIFLLNGINSDSGLNILTAKLDFPLDMKDFEGRVDYNPLVYEVLADTRTVKTDDEIAVLEYVNNITVEAHVEAIKKIKPGCYERDIENNFHIYLRKNYYTRIPNYQTICCCGENSSILHYTENDQIVKDGGLALLDMGARLGEYGSDITSTVPVNGKFSERQAKIYNIVLKANREVQKNLKPGVNWVQMQLLAERVILQGLKDKEINIIKEGANVDQMLLDRVPYYFMPHGLGHFYGLEVHDVGGYLSYTPPRRTEKGLSSIRTARDLVVNNAITVEPGIYFIEFLLEMALKDDKIKSYINDDVLRSYYGFGGVRIEDNVVITSDGCRNLTQNLPREIPDIEKLMSGKH
jgi:Xaa-Pro dipeptidase